MSKIIKELAENGIHAYGSKELLKFEKNMEKYFSREYSRWRGNKMLPEDYGISSFKGNIAKAETIDVSVCHYDEEYHVYQAFLDEEYMAYTMGYFGIFQAANVLRNISIGEAQKAKYKLITARADIQDGQNILDLGCGFGGLSKYLLETYPNVVITAINPSEVQTRYIRNELMGQGELFDVSRFELKQMYFESAEEAGIEEGTFDRVLSIGLIEHITNIDLLQKNIAYILKKGGKCLHHCIVSIDTIPQYLNAEKTIMGTYYPGAHIWPYSELKRHTKHLKLVDSWFLNGINYWKTLDMWHQKFWDKLDTLYPKYITVEEVESWNKYFSLCKTMFSPNDGKSYGNGHYLYEKE